LSNCVFLENWANTHLTAYGGGALLLWDASAVLIADCTFAANVSPQHAAGGIRVIGTAPVITNSIFWDNEGPGGAQGSANQISGPASVSYSIVEGGRAGTGNLDADPLFLDAASGDLRLALASPAIDAGNNNAVPAEVELDLAHNPRFTQVPSAPDTGNGVARIVDLGAYEFPWPPVRAYCSGDGTAAACPCGNAGSAGAGCANGHFADGARLDATGLGSVSADTLVLRVAQSTPSQPGIFFQGDAAVAGGAGASFGDGLRCAGQNVRRIQVVTADAAGNASSTLSIAAGGAPLEGDVKRYQWWYRDPALSPCGGGFNLSNGLELIWVP
jgi:hypothetical protein